MRLVDSMSVIPSRWIADLAEAWDEQFPLPMWGSVFLPGNACDDSNIRQLLKEIDTDCDEERELAEFGWQAIADTGMIAREFDGELLFGIHGAGYDFLETHWSRLYDALGYQWHTK
ncbi:MAG: hypothetical protein HQ518_18605 [Rhodopirellula sp.]|nr:hypothetical protein [Rhodopirellula sp.]